MLNMYNWFATGRIFVCNPHKSKLLGKSIINVQCPFLQIGLQNEGNIEEFPWELI